MPSNNADMQTSDTSSMQPLSVVLRRSLAFLYDSLLLIAVFFVVTAVLLVFTDGEHIQHPLYYALLWFVAGVFFTSFWRRGGRTLGMTAWHLRLVDDDADRAGDRTPLTRLQLWKRFAAGSFLFGVGLLWAFVDARGRSASDRLSKTVIIKDSGYLKRKA